MEKLPFEDLGTKDMTCVSEIVKNRFYFATFKSRKNWHNTKEVHYFSTDEELAYQNFFSDFGPLNLGCLYKYYAKMKLKLECTAFKNKKIVHCTTFNKNKRANAALLVGCFSIIYLKIPPHYAYQTLQSLKYPYENFQDATVGSSLFHISLLDCLTAVHKACLHNLVNFDDFDVREYDKYDAIQNGDMNWIVPQKLLAFSGPTKNVNTAYHRPEFYIDYFQKNNVRTVVRLNRNLYDSKKFTNAGIAHHDLYFVDGSVPPQSIMYKFLELSEDTPYGIAVHCKAGLGRTGTLIGAYLMKHYQMTALEAISWIRICRPGSVIGHQQAWLEKMETTLWKLGHAFRIMNYGGKSRIRHHDYGVYSISYKSLKDKENITPQATASETSMEAEEVDTSIVSALVGKQQQIIGEDSNIKAALVKPPEEKSQEVDSSPKWLLDYLENCKSDIVKPPYKNTTKLETESSFSSGKCLETQGDRLLAVKAQRLDVNSSKFHSSNDKKLKNI